jgi:hypothetical protein
MDIRESIAPESINWNGVRCMPVVVMDSQLSVGSIVKIAFVFLLTQAVIGGLAAVALLSLNVI